MIASDVDKFDAAMGQPDNDQFPAGLTHPSAPNWRQVTGQ